MAFVHFSVFTEFSIEKGICRIPHLIENVKSLSMDAVAITDVNNLFAAVKFFKCATKAGIKPIFGSQIWVKLPGCNKLYQIFLWCRNYQGYQNLSYLLSSAYLQEGNIQSGSLYLDLKGINPENFIGLFVGLGGKNCFLRDTNLDSYTDLINYWQQLCPDSLIGCISHIGFKQEQQTNDLIMQLSAQNDIPVIAVNDVCFIKETDYSAHEARVCIHQGVVLDDTSRLVEFTSNQYLCSSETMQELFKQYPLAIKNTELLAQKCNVWFDLNKVFLPNYPIQSDLSLADYFVDISKQGLETKNLTTDGYQNRLEMECKVIIKMGFAGYFLIVSDFIKWARDNKIAVGPGRGSGAGSLVAYALGITDIDPLKYGLLFERFLNPERVSMPDFDIDFCMDGRDRVINYVGHKYGQENVSQIVTFGTMAARAVVRDVGRILSLPYGFVDKIAKLIPMDLGMTLTKALEQEDMLTSRYQSEVEVKELIDLALKLEGLTRNVGKHAGGVVIAPQPLHTFAPIYCESPKSSIVSQFDKDDIEAIGLVKFDFLGLRTLTLIDWTVQLIRQNHDKDFDIAKITLTDSKAFKLLADCETTAVFQLESRGMKDLIRRLKPDHFEEIVALVALFRPGPLQAGMVDAFIDCKHGRSTPVYFDPCLKEILKPTNGVILYQEQVMQIAQIFAGYTLGEADLLRRAMGKKKPEEMAKQRAVFVDGAVKKGFAAKLATNMFDLIEKFAGYGFNKSHSVAYAMLSYQTAWLKANYPAEFMASALSSDMDNTDKVLIILKSTLAIGIKVLPPNINQSEYKFKVIDKSALCYGLGAIKGIGEALAIALVLEREKNGDYKDICDLIKRLSKHKINRKSLECLIKSGALDTVVPHRRAAFISIDLALGQAEQFVKDAQQGQSSLFAELDDYESGAIEKDFVYKQVKPWNQLQQLAEEKATLGLYLSGHPLESLRHSIKEVGAEYISKLSANTNCFIIGLITNFRVMQGKRGQNMAFVSIEDETGVIDLALFGDAYAHFREYLIKDQVVLVKGSTSIDQFNQGLRVMGEWMMPWSDFLTSNAKHCYISLQADSCSDELIQKIKMVLDKFSGDATHVVFYYNSTKAIVSALSACKVSLCNNLINDLTEIDGVESVYPGF